MIKHEAFHEGLKTTAEEQGIEPSVGQPLEELAGESGEHKKPVGAAKEKKSQVEHLEDALRPFEIIPLMSMLHEFIVTNLSHREPKDKGLW